MYKQIATNTLNFLAKTPLSGLEAGPLVQAQQVLARIANGEDTIVPAQDAADLQAFRDAETKAKK